MCYSWINKARVREWCLAGLWQRTKAGPSERSYSSSLEALLSFFFLSEYGGWNLQNLKNMIRINPRVKRIQFCAGWKSVNTIQLYFCNLTVKLFLSLYDKTSHQKENNVSLPLTATYASQYILKRKRQRLQFKLN